ncbi:hypothetical protein Pyn_26272 [Prunus yedoensis var. nudiflora]|uniref:Uncharacterized protein n=1 Tax=Prunus yedoensis var. nudiflora TaxID=2094558 RepID=A0A314USI5_PRUYE|nr:hypothetical protein Pyn_26272 [Prunus yedoensis var. nudiflora]
MPKIAHRRSDRLRPTIEITQIPLSVSRSLQLQRQAIESLVLQGFTAYPRLVLYLQFCQRFVTNVHPLGFELEVIQKVLIQGDKKFREENGFCT